MTDDINSRQDNVKIPVSEANPTVNPPVGLINNPPILDDLNNHLG